MKISFLFPLFPIFYSINLGSGITNLSYIFYFFIFYFLLQTLFPTSLPLIYNLIKIYKKTHLNTIPLYAYFLFSTKKPNSFLLSLSSLFLGEHTRKTYTIFISFISLITCPTYGEWLGYHSTNIAE